MVIAQILLLPLLGGMWITLADLKGEVAVIKNDVVWMKATFTDLQRRVHDLEHGKETK